MLHFFQLFSFILVISKRVGSLKSCVCCWFYAAFVYWCFVFFECAERCEKIAVKSVIVGHVAVLGNFWSVSFVCVFLLAKKTLYHYQCLFVRIALVSIMIVVIDRLLVFSIISNRFYLVMVLLSCWFHCVSIKMGCLCCFPLSWPMDNDIQLEDWILKTCLIWLTANGFLWAWPKPLVAIGWKPLA